MDALDRAILQTTRAALNHRGLDGMFVLVTDRHEKARYAWLEMTGVLADFIGKAKRGTHTIELVNGTQIRIVLVSDVERMVRGLRIDEVFTDGHTPWHVGALLKSRVRPPQEKTE